MKFEIGDRVKVTKNLCPLDGIKNIHIGDMGTIRRFTPGYNYEVEFDNHTLSPDSLNVSAEGYYLMYGYQLEKVEERKEIMTLKDLRSGMVVETRDGDRYLVLVDGEDIHMMCGDGALHMGQWEVQQLYHDDLTRENGFKDHDIMKVYGRVQSFYKVNATKNLLWERKEIKKMTLEEIEKALGYPVKVVTDHE